MLAGKISAGMCRAVVRSVQVPSCYVLGGSILVCEAMVGESLLLSLLLFADAEGHSQEGCTGARGGASGAGRSQAEPGNAWMLEDVNLLRGFFEGFYSAIKRLVGLVQRVLHEIILIVNERLDGDFRRFLGVRSAEIAERPNGL